MRFEWAEVLSNRRPSFAILGPLGIDLHESFRVEEISIDEAGIDHADEELETAPLQVSGSGTGEEGRKRRIGIDRADLRSGFDRQCVTPLLLLVLKSGIEILSIRQTGVMAGNREGDRPRDVFVSYRTSCVDGARGAVVGAVAFTWQRAILTFDRRTFARLKKEFLPIDSALPKIVPHAGVPSPAATPKVCSEFFCAPRSAEKMILQLVPLIA